MARSRLLAGTAMAVVVGAAAQAAPALPQGGQFVAGSGAIGAAGAAGLQINQLSARGIIDWKSFDIGAGGQVSINNGTGATLNRVTAGLASTIQGRLTATGSVYLINPQGVVVGPGGKVIGGTSVVLSTRDITNGDFMGGGALVASGRSVGSVTNQGTIVAKQGDVTLIGQSVTNQGSIQALAGVVSLAAANTVVLAANGSNGVYVAPDSTATGDVTEEGRIKAAAAALTAAGGNVYTLAGNRNGMIEATGTKTVAGQVWLSAPGGEVQAGGAVSARNADGTGGQITVQGARSTVLTGSLDASGSSGGQVLVGVTAPGTGLSDSTTIADGAAIKAGGPNGGGQVETSGHALTIGAAKVDTAGGDWLLDPTNVTIDSTAATTIQTSLASSNVTIQTTSSGVTGSGGTVDGTIGVQASGAGDITVSSAVSWSSSHTLSLQAYNNLNLNAAISDTSSGGLTLTATNGSITSNSAGTVSLTGGTLNATASAGAVSVGGTVSAKIVKLTAGTGGISLGASVTGTGTGNSVLLNTTGNFSNSVVGGVHATGSGAFWRIYSTDPAQDTPNLTANFYQYGVANNGAVNGSATGNGLIYSTAETVSGTLVVGGHAITRTYNGLSTIDGTTASITAANLSLTGLVSGDTASPTTGAGTFSQSDVGDSLTATLSGGLSFSHGSATVYGYTVSGSIQGVIGSITPATATVNLTGALGKVYDGSTLANLTSANFSVSSLASGETVTVGAPASATYDSANAASTRTLSVTLGPTSYSAGSGTKLTNYILPTSLTANNVTISAAPLQLLNLAVDGKAYDSTTGATLDLTNVTLYGLVGGADVDLVTSGATGTFAQAGAGSNIPVTISGFTLADHATLASNYQIVEPATLTASIAKAAISVTGFGAVGKTYDGGTAATLTGSASIHGVQGLDSVSLLGTAAGNFASADAGANIGVSVSGLSLDTTSAANYSLSGISAGMATISRAPVTLSIVGDPTRTYDGFQQAFLSNGNYSIGGSGFASGEGVTISPNALTVYDSANAGARTVTGVLTISDYSLIGSTKLSNYTFNGVHPDTANVTVTGSGTINAAPLAITVINNPTKTYDATTAATLTTSNYQITGLVGTQTLQIDQTAGTYGSANAGIESVSATIGASYTGGSGFLVSNYTIPTTAIGVGLINPAPLTLGGGSPYNLNLGITGNPTKPYDGVATITLSSSNFNLQGLQGGDLITVNNGLVGTLGSANAGLEPIAVTGLTAGDYTASVGSLTNYTLPTVAYGQGTVTRAPVTVSVSGNPTKTYNGSDAAVVTVGDISFSGFVGTQGLTLNQVGQAAYASSDAGSRTVTTQLSAPDYTAKVNTALTNYTFNGSNAENGTFSVSGSGTINTAPLTILGVSANSKTYNGDASATLNQGTLYGVVGGEDVQLVQGSTGTFSQSTVGTGLTVTPTVAYSLTGGANLNNYGLTVPNLTADIGRKALTITTVAANSRDYDGGVDATVNASGLTGIVGSDAVSLVTTGYSASFVSAHANASVGVSASGFTITGLDAGNYSLNQPGGLSAAILQAPITASIISDPTKTYDGQTTAFLKSSNYSLSGFVGTDGATVTVVQQTSANYNSKNATANGGASSITANLVVPDFKATGTTDLTNYVLPSTATGQGTINQATLIAQIVNDPTKTYDGGTAFDSTTTNTGGNAGMGLLTGNYKILGWATGEGSDVTITKTSATYATQNAGITTLSNNLTGSDFATVTTDLGNYALPTAASGGGTIGKRALTVTLASQSKTYNGTTLAGGLTSGSFLLGNFAGSETGLLNNHTSGTYNSADVNATSVTVTGLSLNDIAGASGFATSNYTLPTSVVGTGTISPVALTLGKVSRVYDATNLIDNSTHAATYTLSGLVGSDTVTLDSSGVSGTYTGTTHVGTTLAVSLTGLSLSNSHSGDYTLASTQAGNFGTITKQSITGSIIGDPTKVYDGTTTFDATTDNTAPNTGLGLLTGNYSLTGFVTGEGATVSVTSGAFNVKDTSAATIKVTGLTATSYTATGATQLTDYSLPTSLSGAGTITPATAILDIASITKVYDGATTLPGSSTGYRLNGIYAGDTVTVASASGSYNDANVAGSWNGTSVTGGIGVNVSAATLGGAQASDYTLQLPAANAAIGIITPATLTLSVINAPSKLYDGSNGVVVGGNSILTGDYNLAGIVSADTSLGVGIDTNSSALFNDATFNSKNVNVAGFQSGATSITATGLGWSDLNFGSMTAGQISQFETNYSLTSTATGSASITPVTVTGSILAQSKTYDGTSAALSLTPTAFLLSGFVNGENANVTRTSGVYFNSSASTINTDAQFVKVGAGGGSSALTVSDYADSGSTGFSYYNYTLPTSLTGAGSIGQLAINLLRVTKTYDGTSTATLGAGDVAYTLDTSSGAVAASDVTGGKLFVSAASGTYNDPDVSGSLIGMNLSGIALGGSQASDYSISPTSTASIGVIDKANLTASIAAQTKVYDGTTATIASLLGQYTITGVHGEIATVGIGSGTYNSQNVVGATTVTVSGVASTDFSDAGSAGGTTFQTGNYNLPTSISGNGTITQASLTSSIAAQTKVYDGTTATTTSLLGKYSITGVHGEIATVNVASGTYDSQNVVGATTVTVSGLTSTNFADNGSAGGTTFLTTNYFLPTSITGTGTITQASLTSSINPQTKVYDGSAATTASLLGKYTITGVHGEKATVDVASGTYNTQNVGATTVTVSGLGVGNFSDGGSTGSTTFLTSNYTLPTAITGTGTITKANLTASLDAQTKVYDGVTGTTASLLGQYVIAGVNGEVGAVNVGSGNYNSQNVANATTVTVSGLGVGNFSDGGSTGSTTFQTGNYNLPTSISGTGTITRASLTAAIDAQTKVYDGTTATTTSLLGQYAITGVHGEIAKVDVASGTYDSQNVANATTVTVSGLGSGNFSDDGSTGGTTFLASNYVLPTSISGTGTITQASLTSSINPQTKVYDGSAATTASLLGQYTITGVHGEVAKVDVASGTYNTQNVGATTVTVSGLGVGNFSDGGSTGSTTFLTSNYTLPTAITGTGTITKANLTASLDAQTKVYDGVTGTTASLLGQYVITGVNGEVGAVNVGSGNYDSQNVANATTVTVSGLGVGNFADGGSTGSTTFQTGNYNLPTSISGNGTITQASLTAAIDVQTKVYDGTAATTTSLLGQYAITGVHGEIATVDVASGTYDSPNVVNATTVSVSGLGSGNFSDAGSAGGTTFQASNYVLPTSISGAGTITKASLTSSIDAQTKVYDGSAATTASLLGQYTITGVHGEVVTVDAASGTYNSPNVVGATTVTVSGLGSGNFSDAGSAGGTTFLTSNYTLPTSISGTGTITKASLTASLDSQTKVYDGTAATTTSLLGQYDITGVNGEVGAVDVASGTYNSPNVATAASVTVSGLGAGNFSDGGSTGSTTFLASNYTLPTSISGTGAITKANLTASIDAQTKVYDGSAATTASLAGQYAITGVHGEVATVDPTSGVYNSPNVASATTVTVSGLGEGNFSDAGSTGGTTFLTGNYNLPTSITGTGTITKASLTASIDPQTKVYDGSAATTTSLAGQYAITGVHGEVATVDPTSGVYNSPNVASATTVTVSGLGAGNFSDAGSTGGTTFLTGNYNLPTSISGTGTITKASLIASIDPQTKVYDGSAATTTSLLGQYAITGVNGEVGAVDVASGTYDSPNVANATTVTVSGLGVGNFSDGGSTGSTTFQTGNYNLPTSISGNGTITQASLTAAIDAQTKVYDGTAATTTSLLGEYAITGVHGEVAKVDVASGTYDSQNVANATTVTVSGLGSGNFSDGGSTGGTTFFTSNYFLPTSISGTGAITQASLTSSINAQTKVYDGSAATTTSLLGQYTITGVHGEIATVGIGSGTYNSQDVASATTVTVSGLGVGNFSDAGSAGGTTFLTSNYVLPTSISGTGTITKASLTASIDPQTKVYDGTTDTATSLLGQYDITGVNGEVATVDVASGAYDSQNVANATTVSVGGLGAGNFSDGGSTGSTTFLASNYTLPTSITGAGAITKASLTASIDPQTKVYDGGAATTASLIGQYAITGVNGEVATVNVASGTYDSQNVASAATVTVNGLIGANFADGGSTGSTTFLTSNYNLPTAITGAGAITPATLMAVLAPQTKVYDASIAAGGLTSGMYTLTGFIGGEGATLTGHASGAYNSKNVLDANTVTVSGVVTGDYQGSGGFIASNYSLPTTITGTGSITPAPLHVANLGVDDKVYDGTTAATLDLSHVTASSLTGVFFGDDVRLSALPGGATFAQADVGTSIAISLAGQAIGGTDASNYVLSSNALPTANITPRPLSASIVGDPTKTYDGGTAATLTSGNFQLTNFVSGQGATVTQTAGTYDQADAGGRTVTASLPSGDFVAGSGVRLSNYILPTSASGAGTIDPAQLTVTIIGDPTKFFDGLNTAKLTSGNYQIAGFIGGQGATIGQTAGTYGALGPGDETVSANLATADWTTTAGTLLGNYVLPSIATGPGHINPPLSSDLYTRYEAQLLALGIDPATAIGPIREIQFTMATPRIYIPFPAPGALSTWKGNGFGSLPIVVDQSTEFAQVVTPDGAVAVQSGPPIINNTEQVLLQGLRSKQYRMVSPSQAAVAPTNNQAAAPSPNDQASAATIGPVASR